MEHVTIISQEAITTGLWWPPCIIGVIATIFLIWVFVYNITRPKNWYNRVMTLFVHVVCCIPLLMITMGICSIFFPVETGRYRYEGTLDPNMTIVEFEEFQQQFDNVRFEDGVWKWEDKE